jgi:CubicO group peptidase (beta-lactamase class C family)
MISVLFPSRDKNRRASAISALTLSALACGLGVNVTATPQTAASSIDSRLDEAIAAAQKKLQIPGLSVAILVNGSITYAKGFGYADVENQVAATTETRFRTASIAKPLTATAVMQLAERGQIDLEAPIQKYCPAYPEKKWPVTARQLLSHTAGVRHYTRQGESSGTEHFFTITDALRLFKDDPLLHQPATKYAYSTYGYSVLGCAIEGASGSTYADYLTKNVLAPAGMTHTVVDDIFQIVPGRSRGYQRVTEEEYSKLPPAVRAIAKPNHVYNAVLHDTSMKIPGGGWLSTPSDMARFGAAMIDGKLVKPATRDAMWTVQKTTDGKETGYGLGFGIAVADGRTAVSHTGNQAGASSLLAISPSRRVVLVTMTNLEDAPVRQIAGAVTSIMFPKE